MSPPLGELVWVFPAGALGDHVMMWPLVRALARQGTSVRVATQESQARLCESELRRSVGNDAGGEIVGLDIEHRRFTCLWRGEEAVRTGDIIRGVGTVITFVAPDEGPGKLWHRGAAAMFTGARRVFIGRPDDPNGAQAREALWAEGRVADFGGVAPAGDPDGPIVLYTGAGGETKRLPPEFWAELGRRLAAETPGAGVHVLIGRDECERGEAERFVRSVDGHPRLRVHACESASELADRLRAARLYVGVDTGPTHLAAQLGVPTVALFGPTDPKVWGPVGPRVTVLAPAEARPMTWLDVDMVAGAIAAML